MYDLFLFAGTTEGRVLADRLRDLGEHRICCFTATEYGKSLIAPGKMWMSGADGLRKQKWCGRSGRIRMSGPS